MTLPEVNQPFSMSGLFWKPDAPDKHVPGRLYRTEEGIRVQLFDDLRPGPSYVPTAPDDENTSYEEVPSPHQDDPLTLHGHLSGGHRVTACECITVQSRETWSSQQVAEYVLTPRHVLFGGHTTGLDQEFTGIKIRTAGLDEWAELPGFTRSRSNDNTFHISLRSEAPEPVSLLSGASLALTQTPQFTPLTPRSGAITRETWLKITGLAPATSQQLDSSILTPLTTLICLCTGQDDPATHIQLTIDGKQWLPLAANYLHPPRSTKTEKPLAGLTDLGLTGVASWLDQVDRLGPLPPVVAHFSAHQRTTRLETAVLELTTVAEGLHARLFPDTRRLGEQDCDLAKKHVREAVKDLNPNIGEILRSMLTHLAEPGYTTRLRELAAAVEPAAPGICGKTNRWAAAVSTARNSYAHRTAGMIEEEDWGALLTVIESLAWLMRCLLLLNAGLSEETLRQRLRHNSSYLLFLNRAAHNLPNAYPAAI
ncbi:MAG: hypothetical protein M3548_17985 [Actinomycetota bacterium]|nr:hypothetical protein [Actinomycetota bacterium]